MLRASTEVDAGNKGGNETVDLCPVDMCACGQSTVCKPESRK